MPLPVAQPLDANGRTMMVIGWDPVNNQFVMPQSGASTPASGQSFSYGPMTVNQVVGTPVYATAVLAVATGGNVSLPAAAGKFTYINGFYVMIGHATTASTPNGQVTLSLDGSTTQMNFLIACSQSYPGLVQVVFPDPIPATAINTAIKVTAPTLANTGAGSISAYGYQL